MQISISTRHGHISDSTRTRIEEKLAKLTRLYERVTLAEVILDVEHEDAPEVEVRLSVEHAPDFLATAEAESIAAATDAAVHKLEKQLRKHKEKFKTRRASSARHNETTDAVPAPTSEPDLDDVSPTDED